MGGALMSILCPSLSACYCGALLREAQAAHFRYDRLAGVARLLALFTSERHLIASQLRTQVRDNGFRGQADLFQNLLARSVRNELRRKTQLAQRAVSTPAARISWRMREPTPPERTPSSMVTTMR